MIETIAAAITFVFLLYIVSYYLLLLFPVQKPSRQQFSSISVIIPARNEEQYIAACIRSVLVARFPSKQIIVVNDASIDATAKEIAKFKDKITLITNKKHSGKSASLNRALAKATGELIAIVDGDSVIPNNALLEVAKLASKKDVGAVAAVVKTENRFKFLNLWVHIELLYNSLLRSLFARANANIVTAGALSVYRADALRSVGGFSTEGFSEDVDIAIKLHRKGYAIAFADNAISRTNMPTDWKGFFRQRTRLARGAVNLLKRHMQLNNTVIDLYTLPLWLFNYVQSVIMSAITIYNLVSGYMTYFADKGVYMSWGVVKFFLEWFSLVGFVRWTYNVFAGNEPWTFLAAVGISSSLLSYPLMLYAIMKYDRLDIWHVLVFTFMFPYWLLLMVIYTICVPEILRRSQYNIWKKNE